MLQGVSVVVRGGGELGSAVARLLHLCGCEVAVLERATPLAVRRRVCYAEAVRAGRADVEGVSAVLVASAELGSSAAPRPPIEVAVDAAADSLSRLRPAVLVDGRMAKRNLGTSRGQAELVVGLGPGFTAGEDVHAVVETQRGPDMGRVIWAGEALPNSSEPDPVQGVTWERVLRAPRTGLFRSKRQIGETVETGAAVGTVEGEAVLATIPGLLRGLLPDAVRVDEGLKLGDIDPRGRRVGVARISDKGRAVGAGVLEAVLVGLGRCPQRKGCRP